MRTFGNERGGLCRGRLGSFPPFEPTHPMRALQWAGPSRAGPSYGLMLRGSPVFNVDAF